MEKLRGLGNEVVSLPEMHTKIEPGCNGKSFGRDI